MPKAVQYGMPINEFWHGDIRLLRIYEKAYVRNISLNAWYQGKYNHIAYAVNMQNMWKKKGTKEAEYPQWKDPFEKFNKPKITKDNLEEEFRQSQANQNAWLKNILHGKK